MKMGKMKNPRILAMFATGMALLVAIIVSSMAWFTASGQSTVGTQMLTIMSDKADSLMVEVPETLAEYERYMGETGTKYDEDDYPYVIVYDHITITMGAADPTLLSKYFRYYIDDTSFIRRAVITEPNEFISKEDAIDNFCLVLEELTEQEGVDPETGDPITEYVDTGNVYWSENGFFRLVTYDESTHTYTRHGLLSLHEGESYFRLKLYFQGDYPFHLLEFTHADISNSYKFDYSDAKYMFAKFLLSVVFDVRDQFMISFRSLGYTKETVDSGVELTGSNLITEYNAQALTASYTGYDLLDATGAQTLLPIPEIYDDEVRANNQYFVDWIYLYEDEEETQQIVYYRNQKANGTASNVTTMALRPLRTDATLYAVWGESPSVTFIQEEGEEDPTVCYVRPKSNYYQEAGYMEYNTTNKTITIKNPGVDVSDTTSTMYNSYTVAPPTREGYRFMGWSTSLLADLTATDADYPANQYAFTAGNEYKRTVNADTTLYAVWRERGVEVTFVVDSTWTHNFASVVGSYVTYLDTQYAFTNNTVTVEIAKHTNLSTAVAAFGTATITSTGLERNLTLKNWVYESYGSYEVANGAFDLIEPVTVYARWNERAEYTVTLDIAMVSSAVLSTYGTFTIDDPLNIDHYSVIFDDDSVEGNSGTFSDEDAGNVTVKVLEGMSIADLGLNIQWHRKGSGLGTNSFEGWYTGVHSTKKNDVTATDIGWATYNSSATKYNNSTPITSDITLYARFN